MKLLLTCVIASILIIIGLSFGAQNDTQVTVNYLIAKGTFSLPSLITFTLILGFLLGAVTLILAYTSLRLKYLRVVRQNKKLQRLSEKAS